MWMMSVGRVKGRVRISLEERVWVMGIMEGATIGMYYAVGCEPSDS